MGLEAEMEITLNGEKQHVEGASITISELLALNKVVSPETVSVQLNGRFISPGLYPTTQLSENDLVDFLYFLGGGKAC
jgi:sulfur carrier protein